ncbi:MAG: DUF4012 domain-containing protein [Patescibacteria group bacterium]
MEGFNKIELGSPTNSLDSRGDKKSNKSKIKPIVFVSLIVLIVLIIISVVSVFTIVLPAKVVYKDIQKTSLQVKATADAVKKQNIAQADLELEKTKKELTQIQKDLEGLGILKFIPFASAYYSDAQHLIKAGFHGLGAAEVLIDSVQPYADILGLKGQGSFVGGTASQRIETAVKTMGKITPHIDDIAKYMHLAKNELDYVDPSRYSSFFGGDKIKKELVQVKKLTSDAVAFVNDARPLIKILPSLLGEPKEKKYLVLFQNDKELRPTGGFITAYAVFRIDKGIIHVDRSDDIYTLDNTVSRKPKAPEPILKYLPKVTIFNLRDTNLSPDFVESMKTFNSLYKNSSGKVDVDGIIALDTNVLVSTIKILDDEVMAGGIKFTSSNDKRCDCPQVIYTLENLISTPKSLDLRITSLAKVQAQRKDILGVLLYAIMEKALKSSPKIYWGPLFQDILKQANEKHVLFYLYNKDAQAGVEALNASGRIKQFDGDYLHINQANFAGAKANLFIKESVKDNFDITNDGTIKKTITINYKNPHPPSDCNLERGNLCLNAVLRDWIRIYTPKGSKLIDSTGSEVKLTTYEELGKTVFEGFLTVRPQGVATFTISYTLPFKLNSGVLPVLIQKQPGTHDNEYTIVVNGEKREEFPLLADKQLKINL